jgi:putative FmdB family regulatory protein
MPIFEYHCKNCGQVSEILVGVARGESDTICPNCGSRELEKLLSAPGGIRMGDASSGEMRCGRDQTCCGRAEPCAAPPCKK